MNTPVSFPLAKLLKEKGFDKQCSNFYTNPRCKMFGIDEHGRYYPIKNKAKNLWISGNAATLDSKHVYYAPTIAEVVMWLYEKHGIWIYPYCAGNNKFHWGIANSKTGVIIKNSYKKDKNTLFEGFNSPTEAYEVAIEYTLNKLI